jgi:hypothetical protein
MDDIQSILKEDPQPRRGYMPGDVVCINVDVYGLWGRMPHPPVIKPTRRIKGWDPESNQHVIIEKPIGMPYSPCTIGVVASYAKTETMEEWENWLLGDAYGNAPMDFWYVATNEGYFMFAHYELQPAGCPKSAPC